MKLFYLVEVAIDDGAIVDDNPPDDLRGAVAAELTASFGDASVRRALGIVDATVETLSARFAEFAREELRRQAKRDYRDAVNAQTREDRES